MNDRSSPDIVTYINDVEMRELLSAKDVGKGRSVLRRILALRAGSDGLREMLAAAWMYGHCRARGFTFAETDIPGCKGSFLWGQAMMDAVAIMPDAAQAAPGSPVGWADHLPGKVKP